VRPRSPDLKRLVLRLGLVVFASLLTTRITIEEMQTISAISAPLEQTSTIQTLQSQLDTLNALSQRLSAIRRAPATLLKQPSSSSGLDMSMALPEVFAPVSVVTAIRNHTTELRALAEEIVKQDVQKALKAADVSYKSDSAGLVPYSIKSGANQTCVMLLVNRDAYINA
jgi:hypothetical protein